jgi:hypothetical protein
MRTLFAGPLPPFFQAILPGGGAAAALALLLLIPRFV